MYCKDGRTSIGEACNRVTQNLRQALIDHEDCKDLVVVIDTCNERTGGSLASVFGVDFSGKEWKAHKIHVNLDRSDYKGD